MPYVCTILLNGADKALLLSSPDEEVMVPLLLMVQLKGDYEEEAVKAQAVIARSNLYRRLAAGEQAGKIMEEVSGEVTGKNTDRNSGGEYSFILDGTLSQAPFQATGLPGQMQLPGRCLLIREN